MTRFVLHELVCTNDPCSCKVLWPVAERVATRAYTGGTEDGSVILDWQRLRGRNHPPARSR